MHLFIAISYNCCSSWYQFFLFIWHFTFHEWSNRKKIPVFRQRFIRSVKTPWSVSLRDFRRWIMLFKWFSGILKERAQPSMRASRPRSVVTWIRNIIPGRKHDEETRTAPDVRHRAVVLSLAICYYVRLESSTQRKEYREQVQYIGKQLLLD